MQLKSWPKHPAHRTQSCCASWLKPSSSWTRPAPMPMPANGSWMPQPMPWTAFCAVLRANLRAAALDAELFDTVTRRARTAARGMLDTLAACAPGRLGR